MLWNSCSHKSITFCAFTLWMFFSFFLTCSFFTALAWMFFSSSRRFFIVSARCWNSWVNLMLLFVASSNNNFSLSRSSYVACGHSNTCSHEFVFKVTGLWWSNRKSWTFSFSISLWMDFRLSDGSSSETREKSWNHRLNMSVQDDTYDRGGGVKKKMFYLI